MNAGLALDPTIFPGKGSRDAWKKSGKVFDVGMDKNAAGDHGAAIKAFEQAISIYPYSDVYYRNLGLAYDQRNLADDNKRAEVALRKAVEADPKDWRNWNDLAGNLGSQKKYKKCRDAAAKALTCKPPLEDQQKLRSNIAELDKFLVR